MRSAGYHEKMTGRTYFGGDQVTQLNLVLYNTTKWPYKPKHSPSLVLSVRNSSVYVICKVTFCTQRSDLEIGH